MPESIWQKTNNKKKPAVLHEKKYGWIAVQEAQEKRTGSISVSARNGYAPCSFFKIPVIKISFVDFLLQSAIMRFRETCNSREQQKRQLFPAAGNK